MKTTKVLLLSAVIAAFSLSAFAGTGAQLLKASTASGVTTPAESTVTTMAYVNSNSARLTPRGQDNQIKVIQGVTTEQNPALACSKTMTASPKAVAECASHANMPGCNPVTVAFRQ